MIKRLAVLAFLALAATGLFGVPALQGRTTTTADVTAAQERAAEQVMAQLAEAEGPMAMDEIDGLRELGPAPWTSIGVARSEKVVEAWVAVANQLPAEAMGATAGPGEGIEFTESEAPDETGGNDSPATGDPINGFGTGSDDARMVTINGHLQGAEIRPPIDFDCPSVEDDGSIPLANDAGPNVPFGALCGGEIGDGPHGESTGDVDFYSFGEVDEGTALVLDVAHISGSLEPVSAVVGIYNAAGELLASAEDSGDPNQPEFLLFEVTEAGEYFGVIAGCCQLPSDPFDPTSGGGVTETGTYEMFVVALAPPCGSSEDDGAIPLANPTISMEGFGEFCLGAIGDGPHGETTGDADFYEIAGVNAGALVFADYLNFDDVVDPVERLVLGLYQADGTLVATAEDSGDPNLPEFIETIVEDGGDYYVSVVGCCELTDDPLDPASGNGVTETGNYQVVIGSVQPPPPPCVSAEDDGAIPLANDAATPGSGDDELFVTFCFGELGDGPHGETTGDLDYYTTREMQEGKVLVVDFIGEPDSAAGDFIIGVYDADGNLVASGQDSPDPEDTNFFQYDVEATGIYHVAITGGLATDPFDPTTGTNTDIVGIYDVFLVDITRELLDDIIGDPPAGNWTSLTRAAAAADAAPDAAARRAEATALLAERRAAVVDAMDETDPVVDVDVFLVDLEVGDAISGGFDRARVNGILDPAGVLRMGSSVNPSFIYPTDSPLRHERFIGFDHVVTTSGVHAVFVTEGVGPYQGELRVVRAGLADEDSDAQQIIFVDFDGASISPSIFGPPTPDPEPERDMSPLASFLANWGLDPSDEDAVIDATIDAVIENLDTDLRILDGRNGDRDASGTPTEFDIEILNSRDHGDRWGDPNVSRIIVGGTIDELTIPTIGIAQSIDPGNQETEESGIVLLDLLSGPAGDPVSLNSYEVAGGKTKIDLIGHGVGHIVAHEVGHYIGNWHTETFNPQVSIMDAGGEFESIFGVGPDLIFGTADDPDADFAEDIFNVFEGFVGTEDTAGRSVFAMSTGQRAPGGGDPEAAIGDMVSTVDGVGVGGVIIDLFTATPDGERTGYLRSTESDADGMYRFDVEPGCYSVVFIAPEGSTFVGGGEYDQQAVCVEDDEFDDTIDAVLTRHDPDRRARIGDSVTNEGGEGVGGVVIDLFVAGGDGLRARFLGDTMSDREGMYQFDVEPGCYVIVFIAPEDRMFVNGSKWSEQPVCVDPGETDDTIDAVLKGK